MKPKIIDKDAIKFIGYKLTNSGIKCPESRLMLAIYEQSMEDYLKGVELLHKEHLRLTTYRNKLNRELRILEIYMSGKLTLTEKRLRNILDISLVAHKTRGKIGQIERRINRVRRANQAEYDFLVSPKNKVLLWCGIEPSYALKLLRESKFFDHKPRKL